MGSGEGTPVARSAWLVTQFDCIRSLRTKRKEYVPGIWRVIPRSQVHFLLELDAAIANIAEGPRRWPRIHGRFRRYLLHKFPFSVIYLERPDFIEVIAVAHHRRKPGYWF